jgi:hypothetical protein
MNARRMMMTLDDPWVFGTARGRRLMVEQRVTVTPREATADEKKEKKKGIATAGVSVAAHLEDGSPGVIVNPVGEGEVVWMPQRILDEAAPAAAPPGAQPSGADAVSLFYAAIAGRMQPALVQLLAGDEKPLVPSKPLVPVGVRAALRASSGGVLLLAIMNANDKGVTLNATVRADAGIALDLATETALPLEVRGLEARTRVTLAPHGWALVAFAKSRDDLDKERNAPRLTARWR